MRISIFVGSIGSSATLEEQIQQVVEVENDGFDGFWSAQVIGVDALTLFALAGQRTSVSFSVRSAPYENAAALVPPPENVKQTNREFVLSGPGLEA